MVAPAKAPATKSGASKKKDAGKKTSGENKKKRSKTRKETYSSYIYKGKRLMTLMVGMSLNEAASSEASTP